MKDFKSNLQKIWRRKRMQEFSKRMKLCSGLQILDLGGTPELWQYLDLQLKVTLLNLPEQVENWPKETSKNFQVVTGDACNADMFSDNTFDVVFSNSVIEHLPLERLAAFAKTVQRLAPAWWVQTPSINFPIEAHCNLPFWWFYPRSWKNWWLQRWQRKGNLFLLNQMQTTTALTKTEMQTLFGECEIFSETCFGFEKSYSVYHLNPDLLSDEA
jgi:hypothetical protein